MVYKLHFNKALKNHDVPVFSLGMRTFLKKRKLQDTHLTLRWRQKVSDTALGRCGEREGNMWSTHFHFGKNILDTLDVLHLPTQQRVHA